MCMGGGVAHLDTFDLKPDVPMDYRGYVRPILAGNCYECHGTDARRHFPPPRLLRPHRPAAGAGGGGRLSRRPLGERWGRHWLDVVRYADTAGTTRTIFLGLTAQCARCHNHPFERWTQDNYYAQRGMLEGTLVVSGGEFGRTPFYGCPLIGSI